jgi:VanZ family protein
MSDRTRHQTRDLPAQRSPRRGIDITAVAQRYAWAIRIAYLICIGIATLLNLGLDSSLPHMLERLHRAVGPAMSFRDIVDAARNVALFLGWGACWVMTSRAPTTLRSVMISTVLGLAASTTVEMAQLFSPNRVASLADVVTNTAGALLGALGTWLVERRATTDLRYGTTLGVPAWIPAGALLLAAASVAFAPSSRPAMIVQWGATPALRAAGVAAAPAATVPAWALLSDAVLWISAGLLIAIAVRDRTGTIRLRQLIVWAILTAASLLVVHEGRAAAGIQREAGVLFIQFGAVGLAIVGGLFLVPVWRRAAPARSTRAWHACLLAAIAGAAMAWTPATWALRGSAAPALNWHQLVPMYSLFQRQDLSSVFLVLQKAGIGAAIGAGLAARNLVGIPQPAVRLALAYAALLELGQVFIPGRFPDITDVLITGAAASLVAVLVERASRGSGTGAALAEG